MFRNYTRNLLNTLNVNSRFYLFDILCFQRERESERMIEKDVKSYSLKKGIPNSRHPTYGIASLSRFSVTVSLETKSRVYGSIHDDKGWIRIFNFQLEREHRYQGTIRVPRSKICSKCYVTRRCNDDENLTNPITRPHRRKNRSVASQRRDHCEGWNKIGGA